MRRIRKVTAEEENFRMEKLGVFAVPRRDPCKPEPIGTVILLPVRVIGYDPDCGGSLMARLQVLELDGLNEPLDPELSPDRPVDEVGRYAGVLTHYGLYPDTGIVATPEEIRALVGEEE